MSRQWPENAAYVEAIQSSSNLGDPDVAGGTHEKKSNGMPRPYSGGFTTTFHVTTPTGEFALRCFTKGNDELEMRYRAITDWLTYVRSGAFCMAAYVPQGIRVNGRWWPVIKMAWVAGKQINTEIESQLGNPNHITHLRDRFRALVRELGILGVAHGDLQHGNIMVDRGELRLIDYDGIYLPALAHLTPSETGHKNFQHPGRLAAPFDGRLDRFSSLVIYTALSALSADASLWQRYNTDENLLFQASDIAEPATSPLFRDLRALPPAATLADRLAAAARLPYDQVPTLEQFIAGAFEIPAHTASSASSASSSVGDENVTGTMGKSASAPSSRAVPLTWRATPPPLPTKPNVTGASTGWTARPMGAPSMSSIPAPIAGMLAQRQWKLASVIAALCLAFLWKVWTSSFGETGNTGTRQVVPTSGASPLRFRASAPRRSLKVTASAATALPLAPSTAIHRRRFKDVAVPRMLPTETKSYLAKKAAETHAGVSVAGYRKGQAVHSSSSLRIKLAACPNPNVEATTTNAAAPDTPPIAQQQGITGVVNVLIELDENSRIVGTPTIQSSPSQLLNAAAIKAAEESTFTTEVKNCKPIAKAYIFAVEFNNN